MKFYRITYTKEGKTIETTLDFLRRDQAVYHAENVLHGQLVRCEEI